MSEEQIEPKRKWFKKPRIIFLSLILICIIALVIVLTVGLDYKVNRDLFYPYVRNDIQDAEVYYESMNNGALPILNGTYTIPECSNCSVINISALLIANGGLLDKIPEGLYLNASGNDNCGGNANLGCSKEGSYIWIVDADGDVYSYCAGTGCTTNNSSYQDTLP